MSDQAGQKGSVLSREAMALLPEEEKIYRRFAKELETWSQDGVEPSTGNQDIRYYLELQEARLKKRNLQMEYRLTLRGDDHDTVYNTTYQDRIYTNMFTTSPYMKETIFRRGDKTMYKRKEPQYFYQTITRMDQPSPQEKCCCPNCGAVSPVKTLLQGCPHCRTRFLMQDLFPKVTGYFFEHDFTMGKKEYGAMQKKWIFGTIAVIYLFTIISALLRGERPPIFSALFSIPIGAFAGYLLMSLYIAVGLFGYAGRNLPRFIRTAGTQNKLTRLMKPHDRNFSYEYFVGRVLGLLKILIFAEHEEELAVYGGEDEIPDYSDIVESTYRGSIKLHRCWVEKGYCYVDLEIYMADIYDTGRIRPRNERYRMTVYRKLQKDSDLGFSLKKVQCAGCGASFDATRERYCPYCDRDYHLEEDDWVAVKIRKK